MALVDLRSRQIDGLRAVAVISVVLYHFGLSAFSGGYVGVDVFFVISGFLITKLILAELEETGRLGLRRFYLRRLRRLLPALLFTSFVCWAVAAFMFSPEYFQRFGASLTAAVLSFSNIYFWTQSGYFDVVPSIHTRVLLHTWSLSVEEQFYLLWPTLLVLFARCFPMRLLAWLIALIGMASFLALYLWFLTGLDPDPEATVFFMTPFRVFEFAVGAMGVFVARRLPTSRLVHEAMLLVGILMVSMAISLFDDKMAFPSTAALLPCVGALLIILASGAQTSGHILRSGLFVGVGVMSYSVYLVHWPVIVFWKYETAREQLSAGDIAGISAITLLLSLLSYFLVEKTFWTRSSFSLDRKDRRGVPETPQKRFLVRVALLTSALAVLGFAVHQSDGWGWRKPHALTANQIASRGFDARQVYAEKATAVCRAIELDHAPQCDPERLHQVLIIGDSHAIDGHIAFESIYGRSGDINFIRFGNLRRCRFHFLGERLEVGLKDEDCERYRDLVDDKDFANRINYIIYSSYIPFFDINRRNWKMIGKIISNNKNIKTIVVGSYITTNLSCPEIYAREGDFKFCKDRKYLLHFLDSEQKNSKIPESRKIEHLYIDKIGMLCNGRKLSSCMVTVGDEPFSYDHSHLSVRFLRFLGQKIAQTYRDELVQIGLPSPMPRPALLSPASTK